MNTIECKVVMLPQDRLGYNQGNIILCLRSQPQYGDKQGQLLISPVDNSGDKDWQAQHLYFTSDEEIKSGNWCVAISKDSHNVVGKISKCADKINDQFNSSNLVSTEVATYKHPYYTYFKIVASTDPSLGLPSIPESFLKKYVAANGKIDKVKLETTEKWAQRHSIGKWDDCEQTLKLTATNEVVIIDIEPKLKKDCQAWYGWGGHDCHTPCNCPLIPIVTKKDASLNDGEDINDASMRTYLEDLEQIKEGFLNEKRAEELTSLLKKPEDKELEDAAKEFAGEIEDMAGIAGYNGFKKGVVWQKQQSVNEPKCATFIKCFDVANLCEQCKSIGQCKVVKSVENTFKEQSANESIEFADWIKKYAFQRSQLDHSNWWTSDYYLKNFPNPEKAFYTSKELYELWQKTK